MIHSVARAHMPYVRRPCQDARAPFEFGDSSTGFAQSSFIHITRVFGRAWGKPEPWGWLPCCWGMAMPCAKLVQTGLGTSVYVRVTGIPVKPPSSRLVLPHPTLLPAGSILPTSSPNAPSSGQPSLCFFSKAVSQPYDTDPWLCFCHCKGLSFRDGAFTHGCLSRKKKKGEGEKKRGKKIKIGIVGSEWKIKPGRSSKLVFEN